MTITFQQSLDYIARLVKQFNTNRAAYLAPGFKEAQARQALIDPFFIALGWDVHNSEQAAPDYQFVLVEENQHTAGLQRAPDYTFRTGKHDRKFFAEAKKPGAALKSSADAGYQLRSYGWNAKLPVSILTDFDEFAVYNCRRKPLPKDKSNVARLHYYTCDEYAERWREIWDVFSLEAVRAGAFDQFARSGQSERGASTADAGKLSGPQLLDVIQRLKDIAARMQEFGKAAGVGASCAGTVSSDHDASVTVSVGTDGKLDVSCK